MDSIETLPFFDQLNKFGLAVSEMIARKWKDAAFTHNAAPRVMVESVGKRYIKLARFEQVPAHSGNYKSTSVYCFVDKTNGDLLKGSWKAPVANGVRGNLVNDSMDVLLKKFTEYGPAYLR